MLKEKISRSLLKPPKGIGISRRLLITMAGTLIFILILFLFFLHHYADLNHHVQSKPIASSLETESSIPLIEKVQSQFHKPVLVPIIDRKLQEPIRNQPGLLNRIIDHSHQTGDGLTMNEFEQGSNSQISVYQGNFQNGSSPMGLNSNPDPSIAYSGMPRGTTFKKSDFDAQNRQVEKVGFLKNAQSKSSNPSELEPPSSPYEIKAGTIIPATLITGINSDLPGTIIGKVNRHIFDTVTGNYLLIPQGTTLMGLYDSQIVFGQKRVLIAWSRLTFPNGQTYDLNGMPGVDMKGMAGLSDQVDNHYSQIFGSTLMLSLFGAAGQLSQPRSESHGLTVQQILYGAVGQQMSQTGAQLMAKNMNIQPTVKIRPGMNFNVLLTKDLVLSQPYRFAG